MAQLDIIITNRGTGSGKVPGGGTPGGGTDGDKAPGNSATSATRDSAVKNTAAAVYIHSLVSTASNSAKTLLKFASSQYGDFTGNYIGQRKIDNAIAIAEGLVSVGSTVVMGAIAGGFAGAAFGLAIYGINQTVGQIQSDYQYSRSISKTNAVANYNSQRIGSILVDGNRG